MRPDFQLLICDVPAAAPETCGAFGEYCIPKTATFPSVPEFEALLSQTTQCDPTLQGSSTAIATALTPECDAWRARWVSMLGCPECVDEAIAHAAATPTCHAMTTEAECNAALISNNVPIRTSALPLEPASSDGAISNHQATSPASFATNSVASSSGIMQLAAAVVSMVCMLLV